MPNVSRSHLGGALTSAKGALSTLWTSFTAASPPANNKGEGDAEEAVEAFEEPRRSDVSSGVPRGQLFILRP